MNKNSRTSAIIASIMLAFVLIATPGMAHASPFGRFVAWFSQWRNPVTETSHQENVLNRLETRFEELDKIHQQALVQIEDYGAKGYSLEMFSAATSTAQEKLDLERVNLDVASTTISDNTERSVTTNEDVRLALKAADESIRVAGQTVTAGRVRVREIILRARRASRN